MVRQDHHERVINSVRPEPVEGRNGHRSLNRFTILCVLCVLCGELIEVNKKTALLPKMCFNEYLCSKAFLLRKEVGKDKVADD